MRIHREVAETLFMALIFARDGTGNNPNDLRTYMVREWCRYRPERNYHTQGIVDLIDNLVNDRSPGEPITSLTDVVNDLADQLREAQHGMDGSHDKDLIDTVVRYLQTPFARGMMDNESLKRLRKAILIPEELTGLKAKLDRYEQTCTSCGHRFVSGEMASIMFGTREGSPHLRCTNCYIPMKIACANKTHSVPAPKNLGRTLEKAREKCDGCEEEMGGAAEPPVIRGGNAVFFSGETAGGRIEVPSALRDAIIPGLQDDPGTAPAPVFASTVTIPWAAPFTIQEPSSDLYRRMVEVAAQTSIPRPPQPPGGNDILPNRNFVARWEVPTSIPRATTGPFIPDLDLDEGDNEDYLEPDYDEREDE